MSKQDRKARQKRLQQKALKRAKPPRPISLASSHIGHPQPSSARLAQRLASLPQALAQWPSEDQLAANLPLLEAVDGMSGLRNMLRDVAARKREWAGIPMPLEGTNLIIEPSYRFADELKKVYRQVDDAALDPEYADVKIRNRFWSWKWHSEVYVYEHHGKIQWAKVWGLSQFALMCQTLSVADAWGIEQEGRAVQLLGTLLRHRQFKQYLMTGTFSEKSKRSGVHYMFRRLRPTIAYTTNPNKVFPGPASDLARILAALCLHPIGYYESSWAGAMCPTDDVVAHLMLMRGDEHLFWRRANQHPAWDRNAGIS